MDDPIKRATEHLTRNRINFTDEDMPVSGMGVCGSTLLLMFNDDRSRYIEIEFSRDHRNHLAHLRPGGGFVRVNDPMPNGIC